VAYGIIPHDHWHQPDSIDEEKARISRFDMLAHGVIYGGSVPFVFIVPSTLESDLSSVRYRNMCRFNSGVRFYLSNHALADLIRAVLLPT
jgi:alpha 1,2-mannosyltransferase